MNQYFCHPLLRRPARVVEEARLESVYTPKGYRGFESLGLRKQNILQSEGVLFYGKKLIMLLFLRQINRAVFLPVGVVFYKPGNPQAAAEAHQPGLQQQ